MLRQPPVLFCVINQPTWERCYIPLGVLRQPPVLCCVTESTKLRAVTYQWVHWDSHRYHSVVKSTWERCYAALGVLRQPPVLFCVISPTSLRETLRTIGCVETQPVKGIMQITSHGNSGWHGSFYLPLRKPCCRQAVVHILWTITKSLETTICVQACVMCILNNTGH